jgi:hypothetical protein
MIFAIGLMAYIQIQNIFNFFVHRMTYYDIIQSKSTMHVLIGQDH